MLLLTFGLGVAVGWFGKSNSHSEAAARSSFSSNSNISQESSNRVESVQEQASSQPALSIKPAENITPPDLFREAAQARAKKTMDKMKSLEEQLQLDPFNPDLNKELAGLIEGFLTTARSYGEIPALTYLAANHPFLLQKSLDHMTQNLAEDGALKNYQRFVVGLGLNDEYRNAERYMLQKVVSGEPIDRWFAWADTNESYRIQLPETARHMLSLLPSITDSTELSIAINAIAGPGDRQRNYLSAAEEEQFQNVISPIFDSGNDMLRARAIATLSPFPRSDNDQLLLKGLNDSASIVRKQSYSHFFRNELHNLDIGTAIVANINNTDLELGERQLALWALSSKNRIPELDQVIRDLQQKLEVESAAN